MSAPSIKEENEKEMSPKAIFVKNIQSWVFLDSQLKQINEKTRKMREKKHELLNQINCYVTENDLKNAKIEISDGELKFGEKKEYSPLTFNYLQESLEKIISDKKHVEYIINYLKENRQIKTTPDIRRTSK